MHTHTQTDGITSHTNVLHCVYCFADRGCMPNLCVAYPVHHRNNCL